MHKKIILEYLGGELNKVLNTLNNEFFEKIQEIRLRINKPIILYANGKEYTVTRHGDLSATQIEEGYITTTLDLSKTIELISNFSLYAFENELKRGYITLPGGHRVGVSGKAVISKGEVKTISNISGLNIRVSHEIFNCSKTIIDYITLPKIMHTMIISPPGCGKTTLLRDIVRQISNGINGKFMGQTVGVVDERSEIAGCYMGVPQNNVGIRTDVLDACPKVEGMIMLLRSMSPRVLAVDEIGKQEDIFAINDIINAGIKVICTVHGSSIEDVKQRDVLLELINKKIFERYIVLEHRGKPGTVKCIYDKNLKVVYQNL